MKYVQIRQVGGELFAGDDRLYAGSVVRAMFPQGWQQITLAKDEDGNWCIPTIGLRMYSPVGLFIERQT